MDVYDTEKDLLERSTVDTSRPPLLPADKNNGTTHRSRTREVSSRYRSASPSASSTPRRCPSPNTTRTAPTPSLPVLKRATSAERKRPSAPLSPPNPSTPAHDTSTDVLLASRKTMNSRLPEMLWPSTMRSLSVSFQSDTFSVPISKRGKPLAQSLADRTLRPPSNVTHKKAESAVASRKPTPERKRSPLKGKNGSDQLENSRPTNSVNARQIEQYQWPSRASARASSNSVATSIDLIDKAGKTASMPHLGIGTSPLRRLSLPGRVGLPLQKSTTDAFRLLSSFDEIGRTELETCSVDNKLPEVSRPVSSSSSERMAIVAPALRSQSLPTSRNPSPSKASVLSYSFSKGASTSQTKVLSSAPSRGVSPSRIRPSSPTKQFNDSTSVLSFIADLKKAKKAANHIEEVHQLRLLYNRHLQWRYANARTDAALCSKKLSAERRLYTVWHTTSEMWDAVIRKRIDLQQLRLKLKLYTLLDDQLAYLNAWALIEREHMSSLSQSIRDLQSSILRLPVTLGAWADVETVKAAVCSAVDVMQAMGSSICSTLSKAEEMNWLVSELAGVAAQERAMLDECHALLASVAAIQVEEYSLRTNLIQLKNAWKSGELSIIHH